MSDEEGYDAKSHRSPSAIDLIPMMEVLKHLEGLDSVQDTYIDDAEFLVVSSHDYVIGTWWWDSQAETWRADFKRFGEER